MLFFILPHIFHVFLLNQQIFMIFASAGIHFLHDILLSAEKMSKDRREKNTQYNL